jgi:hypothetical protein
MKLKPKLLFLLVFLTGIIAFSSCNDIIEPSIATSQEILEAPFNGYSSANYSVGFWWDQVNHALQYHMQIVTPNFDTVGSLVLDTLVSTNKFTFNLSPGKYQWRVRAENGSSTTAYTSARSFTILASSLTQQTEQLSAPVNNTLTNQGTALFQWQSLYGATQYQLEIDTNNFQNVNALVYNQTIPGVQVNFTFPKDQTYQWRVRAENDTAQSQWSAVNIITFDNIPPGPVSLVAPTNKLTIASPVALSWNSVATAWKYKLYVFQSDSVTTYNSSFPMLLNSTNYNFTLGSSGNRIYWKVSAVDAAGNEGQASALNSFVLQ